MRQRLPYFACALIVALAVSSCAQSRSRPVETATRASASALTPEQQKVVDYVLADWGKQMHVTGVTVAMRAVGGDYTPDDRHTIGMHLKNHPELHRTLRTFGWETVALTPLEKRIALVLSRAERERRPVPSLNELTQPLRETPEAITASLPVLERFGILRRDRSAGGVGYRMADERYVDWEGAMRITFMDHRVEVEGLEPFNVN